MKSKNTRNLASYPLEFRGTVNFDGKDHEILYKQSEKDNVVIEFLSPSSLSSLKLSYDNGDCTLHCGDLTIPINDGGYSYENGILLISRLFTVTAKELVGAENVKRSGVKYCVEEYSVKGGSVLLYFGENEDFPDIIEGEINGHRIELIIVNE